MFAQRPSWSVNETAFENTQTMIAKLTLDGKQLESPNDMVGAFVGNECRGVASPVFIPATGKYYTYLTVFSNKQGEEITFKLYEHSTGRIVPVDKKLNFNINGHIGSYFQAYSIAMPTLSNQAAISSFELYNVKTDSVVTKGDVQVYYVPSAISKDTIITNFTLSAGARVYVKEVPVISKLTKVNFTNPVIFQVVSQDESTLVEYKVSVINSPIPECSSINIPKPTTSNLSYCINANAGVLSATALTGKSLLWYGTNATGGTSTTTSPLPITSVPGDFTFYVSQKDLISNCESDRAKIVVTVHALPTKPTVTLDASYNLVSSVVSGNQWYKEGIIINGAVSSIFKPASNGTYTVKVTNTAGCTSDMSTNFSFLITAITSLAKEEFVTFSPNPVVDELRVQFYLINSSKAYISILDMNGRPILYEKEMAPDSTISLRELPSGVYVLRLLDSEGRLLYTQKIVKI